MEDMLVNAEAKSAVLVSSKPGCFIAGADIAWLDSAKDKEEVSTYLRGLLSYVWTEYEVTSLFFQLRQISINGQVMMQKLESSPKPVVAAINGSCLGGGLEVSSVIQYFACLLDTTVCMTACLRDTTACMTASYDCMYDCILRLHV